MGKGRLPLGHTGDTLSALGFGILPSIGPRSSFLAVWARNSPYGRFNWKPVLGEGQARERRIRHLLSWAGVPALAAVTLHRGPSFIGHGTLRKGRQTKRAVGRIGDWFVSVGGERLTRPMHAPPPALIDACMSLKIAQLQELRTAPAAHGDGGWWEGPVACPPLDGHDAQVMVGWGVGSLGTRGHSAVTVARPVAAPLETGMRL